MATIRNDYIQCNFKKQIALVIYDTSYLCDFLSLD